MSAKEPGWAQPAAMAAEVKPAPRLKAFADMLGQMQ